MDKHERSMYRPIPTGYVKVKDGPIQPTDICLSVYEGEWLEFGPTEWLGAATLAEDAFMVARPISMLSRIESIYGGHYRPSISEIYGE